MIEEIFNKPCLIGIIGDINTGKSNLVYSLIKQTQEMYKTPIVTFGLRANPENTHEIFSIDELEQVKNSIVFIDEYFSLFDLDDRKKRRKIENTLRLIAHNNNILVLIGLPENFKKFIASKLDKIIYKKVTIDDFINGSKAKKILQSYSGSNKGTNILDLKISEAILFNSNYKQFHVPYIIEYDSKKDNSKILELKCAKSVQ